MVMLVFVVLFLMVQSRFCTTPVIDPGGLSYDPAPGHSPGPPETTEMFPGDECQMSGPTKDATDNLINFTLSHRLFKTDLLVTRIQYQGKFYYLFKTYRSV